MISGSGYSEAPVEHPSEKDIGDFWKEIVGCIGEWDPADEAIRVWERDLEWSRSLADIEQYDTRISIASEWQRVVKKVKSWKAPGTDGIQGFWWKVFPGASNLLRDVCGEGNKWRGHHPSMARHRVHSFDSQRSGHNTTRPIACLNTMYKMLTACVEQVVRDHVTKHDTHPQEQCALRRGRRGYFDALMVNSMVAEDATLWSRNLRVVWIDYQKGTLRIAAQGTRAVQDPYAHNNVHKRVNWIVEYQLHIETR